MIFNNISTPEALTAAILAANGAGGTEVHEIKLVPGATFTFTERFRDSAGSYKQATPLIQSSITISGHNNEFVRQEGSESFRFFSVVSPTVLSGHVLSLKGLTFRNGYVDGPDDGGAIVNDNSILQVIGCQFIGNSTGTAADADDDGGAIYNTMYGITTCINCIFSENVAQNGGAIANISGNVVVLNCEFYNNVAKESGGAIYSHNSYNQLTVKGCILRDNEAFYSGGAIAALSGLAAIESNDLSGHKAPHGATIRVNGDYLAPFMSGDSIIKGNRIHSNDHTSVENISMSNLVKAHNNWWGATNGPSGAGAGLGDSVNSWVSYIPFLTSDEPSSDTISGCGCYGQVDRQEGPNPISLRLGEKRLNITDLSIQTPAGPLSFTRQYRQFKQTDPAFRLMGLGWTHNHHYLLRDETETATPPRLVLMTSDGGRIYFDRHQVDSTRYQAALGSTAEISIDSESTTAHYVMTNPDKSTYEFDENRKLRKVVWPNHEYWIYRYYGDDDGEAEHFALGELKEVVDDGNILDDMMDPPTKRKLQLVYLEAPTFNNGGTPVAYAHNYLLWRVGDHTAAGLDGSTPSGRYIELGYVPEQTGGSPIVTPKALLASVSDVRYPANTWTYTYYGLASTEHNTDYLNWLTSRQTPLVDTDGDLIADTVLTPEKLTYSTYPIELAVNGDMEADSDWTAVGTPSINERSDLQSDSPDYSRRVVASSIGQGIEGGLWRLVEGRRYTISARVYVKPDSGSLSPAVKMHVTGTAACDQVSSLHEEWEALIVTDYTPDTTMDCKLQFIASALDETGHVEFFVDSVSIQETNLQIYQSRGYFNMWSLPLLQTSYEFAPALDQTIETGWGTATTHHFQWGMYQGTTDALENTARQTTDGEFRVNKQVDANQNVTGLDWSSDGKLLNSVTDAAGNQTQFTYDTDDRLLTSVDAEGRRTEYTYADPANPRLPTQILVKEPVGTTKLRWQTFAYDSQGRTICEMLLDPADPDGHTVLQKTTRSYYATGYGSGLLKSITQHDLAAAVDATDCDEEPLGDSVTTTYTYEVAGRVIETKQSRPFGDCCGSQTEYDVAGNVTLNRTIRDWSTADDIKNPVTTYVYDEIGRRVQTTTNVGTDFEQTTLTLYDGLDRVIRTITNFKQADGTPYSAPLTWEWDATNRCWKDANDVPISHGVKNTQNSIRVTDFNQAGQVRLQQDTLGNVTLYGYEADRLIKTVQNASNPNYNNKTTDLRLVSYVPGNNPDQDLISTSDYDAVGNVIKTVSPLGNASGGFLTGYVTFTAYDALNRPVKVIRNTSEWNYDTFEDPLLVNYEVSTDPDMDLVDVTEYDAMGRVFETRRLLDNRVDELWVVTRNVYDSLGRQVKVITNYVAQGSTNPLDWEWSVPNNRWEDGDGNAIDHGGDNDQNLITETIYAPDGRVNETRDLMGTVTHPVYDGLNRPIKTVASYNAEDGNPADWAWDDADDRWEDGDDLPLSFGSQNDRNILQETLYDGNGRVQQTRDVLGRVNYTVYDSVGRTFRTIGNYIPQGSSDPFQWKWSVTNSRWEDGAGNAIDFGTNNDQNIISETMYDDRGRVSETIDKRHNVTRAVYDELGRRITSITNFVVQATEPENWLWNDTDGRWEDGATNSIDFGDDNDQNRISTTLYDIAGRVIRSRDAAGVEAFFCYDRLGRRLKTVTHYVPQGTSHPADWAWNEEEQHWEDGDGNTIDFGTNNDQNLINEMGYNKVGQVMLTRDALGTQTAFTYDKAGRQLTMTRAVATPLETTSYTCYDKAGRVLRTIQNYIPLYHSVVNGVDTLHYDPSSGTLISPDAKDESGSWLFVPPHHSDYHDWNLITDSTYDRASRRLTVTDPIGNRSINVYLRDGQVDRLIDPMGVVAAYRYDRLRRRFRVVQNYKVQDTSDPQDWVIVPGAITPTTMRGSWKQSSAGATILHGDNQDENIIVDVIYDPVGRVTSHFNPHAFETQYTYDALDRRIKLTNSLTTEWETAYSELPEGKTRTTMTYPGLAAGGAYAIDRDFDRLGRLAIMDYHAASTPKVTMSYDGMGNRSLMVETIGSTTVRETQYSYDALHRLTNVGFNTDGIGAVDETLSYKYDVRGLRTQLTLPGNLDITYVYDDRGQLVSLTDWDSQTTHFAYDLAGRHIATQRANRLRSRYRYDAGGRLHQLRHTRDSKTLAHFEYQVDERGNRTQALEALAKHDSGTTTIFHSDPSIVYRGAWSTVDGFKESTSVSASLAFLFLGSNNVTLKMGQGPDHSIYDIYVGGSFWQSFDGYAPSAGEVTISIPLSGDGLHHFEIRNRPEKRKVSTGHKLRFKSLSVDTLYDLQSITYAYDGLSRLQSAQYYAGQNLASTPFRQYNYVFDRTGNRTRQITTVAGTPTTTNYAYNAANQLISDDTNTLTYDNNGNLTSDGVNSYTWDRANHLLSMGGVSYQYDGEGRRVQQTVGATITKYLLDIQPGLAVVLSQTEGSDVTRFVHAPRGIHARQDASNDWHWSVQDGLSTIRMETDNLVEVEGAQDLDPFGNLIDLNGTIGMPYGFTGELVDGSGLLDLRARRYSAGLGVFASLDPFEGISDRAISLNGYSWVEGNVPNAVDPSGLYSCDGDASTWADLPSACEQVDVAYRRAQNTGVSDISSSVHNGVVNFEQLKAYIQVNFGFSVVGYSPTIPEGIIDCGAIEKLTGKGGAPAKLSLVRATGALLHIASYFNLIGIHLDNLKTNFGSGSTLQLVADTVKFANGNAIGAFTGYTPLPGTGLNVYLGSNIPMYAIVHELGHLLDKRFGLRPSTALDKLRLRALNGLPIYTLPPDKPSISDFLASNLGLGGRANASSLPEEVWADMFMTAVLSGQGIDSAGEIIGTIQWLPTGSRDNYWVGAFKRTYTTVAMERLMLGGEFPSVTDTNEQKIKTLTDITNLINPFWDTPMSPN